MAKRKKFDITKYISEEELKEIQKQEVLFLKEGIKLRLELVYKILEIINDEKKRVSVNELANAIKLINSELRASMKDLGNLEKALNKIAKSDNTEDEEIIDSEYQELLAKASQLEKQVKEFTM